MFVNACSVFKELQNRFSEVAVSEALLSAVCEGVPTVGTAFWIKPFCGISVRFQFAYHCDHTFIMQSDSVSGDGVFLQ